MTARGNRRRTGGRGASQPIVTHRRTGWRDPYRGGFKLCATQITHRCQEVPAWKVDRLGQGYVATGFYCDDHLPVDCRPLGLGGKSDGA